MPPKKAKGNGGYRMAELVKEGTIVKDAFKKEWKVGASIGKGGFGLIYLTQPSTPASVPISAPYVMKMEPVENGPLFCEISCFNRAITPKLVSEYTKERRMSFLGVPAFHAMGSHTHKEDKYRFMVIQRMDRDLEAIIASTPSNSLPASSVFYVASQVLDALEYLHSKGLAHADIKAGNIMTGQQDESQIYLIDYGLATRFSISGVHKAYVEDKKLAHNGTCIFTSRDAHRGAYPSARGDLEILGYCMWHWLQGTLPWQGRMEDAVYVAAQKERYMEDIEANIGPCIMDANASKLLCKYMSLTKALEYDQEPDYSSLKATLKTTKPPKNLFATQANTTTPKVTKKSSILKSPKSTKKASTTSTRKSRKKTTEAPSLDEGRRTSRSRLASGDKGVARRKAGRKAVMDWDEGVEDGDVKVTSVAKATVSKRAKVVANGEGHPSGPEASKAVSPRGKLSSKSILANNGENGKVALNEAANKRSTASKHLPKLVNRVLGLQQTSKAVQTSPGLLGLRNKMKLSK